MKTAHKQILALLLALALLLSLCACAQKTQPESDEPKMSTDKVDFPTKAETSLGWLRDRIEFPMTMFGAAYLGYVGGLFEEGFEAGFPPWLRETNEAMLLEYPFLAEIDKEHMIGGAGHLYCIVPVDENATGGTVDLNWVYEGSDEFEEMWSGFWTIQPIQDGPSYVTLSLSLVGGKNYGVTDGPMYLCETYPLLISPSGTELLVGAGESGICLPFMSQSTTAYVLTQAVG